MSANPKLGGKGTALALLGEAGFDVPAWFAVLPGEVVDPGRIRDLGGEEFAVRSSAHGEDGGAHSFAGQLESHLRVSAGDVIARVEDVRQSGRRASVKRYQQERGIGGDLETTVLVQRMIGARVAGVAFSSDPVSGRRAVTVVSAVAGTAERLVSGEEEGEIWRYGERWHERGKLLTDDQAEAVVTLTRRCADFFGRPQDIEWAFDGAGKLWLLQSRPITTLGGMPDPDGELRVWDNSNIAESYGGVTTAMTFSFARRIYEHVYREFCRLMKVPERRVTRADGVFPQMLGMIRGRTYYNLLSWYRVLALLPGFSLNRRFMEQMMGVKEGLPADITDVIAAESKEGRLRDGLALVRTIAGLVWSQVTLRRRISDFRGRLDDALAASPEGLRRMSGDDLVAEYRRLEAKLLKRWDAPLVNDFLAMVFNGVLRKLCAKWLGDESLANRLIRDCGGIISAEPPRRIREMGLRAAGVNGLSGKLVGRELSVAEKLRAMDDAPGLRMMYETYLEDFGDRCLEELKLESPTVGDDPSSLLVSIGAIGLAGGKGRMEVPDEAVPEPRGWWRRWVFRSVLRATRERIRDRENLRFERTRLFGRVRRIIRELGRRLVADGELNDEAEVFHLELDELLGCWEGNRTATGIGALVAARKAEFEKNKEAEPPPDRFETRGPLHLYRKFPAPRRDEEHQSDSLCGIGACPGIVRGKVRVIDDPREERLEPGEILVARQTDPGWVVLFPCAAGLLVERGSVLSHSAIVSRELGLPCVVSLRGVMGWLKTGDAVEMNGMTGEVIKIDPETE